MKVIICTAFALLLHLFLGWEWTLLAGVLYGLMTQYNGWLWGGLSVAAGWGLLVLFNFVVASAPVGEMTHVTGQILGNLPGALVVVMTLLIGGLLGILGGLVGTQLAQLVPALRLYKPQVVA
ncbi:MAG: hypothetical protein AAF564_16685 [Bacteroidota bacterium]